MHTSPESPGILDDILSRAGPLPAVMARNGERLRDGVIYVAPPDRHLLIEPGTVRVTKGPKEHRFRPAVDPLFRSAAQVYGPAVIGVVLTGNLDDGTAGLWAIKQLGGTAIVQDPDDAECPSMPTHALAHVDVDYIVPLAELAPLLGQLTSRPPVERRGLVVPEHVRIETQIAKEQNPIETGFEEVAEPSIYACPECHGVLLKLNEGDRIRFRCHTGHAYSIDSLLAAVNEGVEAALWNSVRSLEEAGLLITNMAEHLRTIHGERSDTSRLTARADEVKTQAETVRQLVIEREAVTVSKA